MSQQTVRVFYSQSTFRVYFSQGIVNLVILKQSKRDKIG